MESPKTRKTLQETEDERNTPSKRGPKFGSKWNDIRPRTWKWKEESKQNRKGGRPRSNPYGTWPGPFVPRTDYPELTRDAYWVNCAYCNQLFCRSVTWVKGRSNDKAVGHGTGGTSIFCSITCGKHMQVKPVFRTCSYCIKTFRVWGNNRHKRTCCEECANAVMREHQTSKKNMPLIAYAYEHGVEADYTKLTCNECGADQKNYGKNARTNHWAVRISEVNGKYMARCKICYQKAYNAQKALAAAMTPAERLRRQEAQELITEMKRL